MIEFPYSLFTETDDFPVHLQYGFHERELYQHCHKDFSELVIVLDGKAHHIVGKECYPISKGAVFVVGQNTEHGFTDAKHLTICNIMYREEVLSNISDMKQLPGFQALFVLEPHYTQHERFISRFSLTADELADSERMINTLMQEYTQKRTGWRDMVLSGFHAFCVTLSRNYRNGEDEVFLKLADAAAYIENHFTEHITISELTAVSGYSERHFLRLFHDILGTSPGNYITSLRIEKAKYLIRCTALSIGEIAWRCGFDDQNYFARVFRSRTGQTPSAYRNKYQYYE